jgi:predicted 2-oxoglutarate/Fe(II)-dependent dioxygenase YbiX
MTVRAGGSNVRVHDAFVVRYDADAQRFLPAHVDQSEISVTLALNALGEYEGGGTTFPDPLRVTARPDIGGVVAFGGDLRHAGAPVTKGVRYIVAAFLFTV